MIDKIKAQLKAKYPGVNLSQKRIDAIAAKLSKKVKEESEIDQALDDLNDITPFADIAKDDDRVRTLEAKLKDSKKPASETEDPDNSEDENEPAPAKKKVKKDDVPAWAQSLITEVQSLKAEKVKGSIAEKVKAHEKLKDIPEVFFKGRNLPEKEDDIETFVTQIESDYTALRQDLVNQGIGVPAAPVLGTPDKDGISSSVKSFIEAKTNPEKAGAELGGKKL